MKRAWSAFLILLAGPLWLFGQSAPEPAYEQFPRALGFQAGPISATGLSYHRWNGSNGFQLTAGVVYLPPGQALGDTTLDYNVGVEYQRRVFGEAFASWFTGQLYLFGGVSHRGYIPVEYGEEGQPRTGRFTPVLRAGAGIGVEMIALKHFSLPVEAGYVLSYAPTAGDPANAFQVNLRPQVGFRYRY